MSSKIDLSVYKLRILCYNNSKIYREPLKTHLREKELLAPTASSSLLTLRGLPGSGEVSSLRDRVADRQTSKLSEPFLAFGARAGCSDYAAKRAQGCAFEIGIRIILIFSIQSGF